MQVFVHIGLPHCGPEQIQRALDEKRGQLAKKGTLFPSSPGKRNHTRLYMAVSDPEHVDPLRWHRGFADPAAQADLQERVMLELEREVAAMRPDRLILSAAQLASLSTETEIARLHGLLRGLSDDITIVAHVGEPARVALRNYAEQIMEGRTSSLDLELQNARADDWRAACLAMAKGPDPAINAFAEIQVPPFWLDYTALAEQWSGVFGPEAVQLRPFDPDLFYSRNILREVADAFALPGSYGKIDAGAEAPLPSAAYLARARQMNVLFTTAMQGGAIISRSLLRRLLAQVSIGGDGIEAGSLHALSERFAAANRALAKRHPALSPAAFAAPEPAGDWVEADPGGGFRATQYMTVFLPIIEKATREARRAQVIARKAASREGPLLSEAGKRLLPPTAQQNLVRLAGGRFAPHNRLGAVNEEELAAAYTPAPPRTLAEGSSGRVIVACMKNEAPYIVEWVAYHRAIGVDNFLIYTNDCTDGTDEILARLQALGIVTHRNNDAWKGKSPQQHALNKAMKEDLVRNAEWLIHIDVDEFINVRVGNGTLDDFLERVPGATNVAMTWRLFGHNGITRFEDRPVIEQFDACAPKFCPKPHTVWGFKTMVKNIGAYSKLSCHRPNKLIAARKDEVRWVNGSGADMGEAIKERGWRSEMRSIGYDMLQLNHYALRSAESFLIKRQRGRALHVDRSIGLNYWVRMDWSDHRDITIKRNLPRLKAQMDTLLADEELARLHAAGVAWHRKKAAELHQIPEFEDLYKQALATQLSELERVAFALSLDMEN